ncbi:TIGR00296 family protein [Desulfurobacterium sp.]
MKLLDIEKGEFLVKVARAAVETLLTKGFKLPVPEGTPEDFFENRGVFVTIKTYPHNQLRGCIGFPEPVMPLIEATIDAAISAATRDPRFPPLSPEELENVTFEVTVLTPPELITAPPEKLPEEIKVGRDGLIVRCGFASGLLLPQVPVEWNWDEREFLSQTCIKAGMPPDCWKSPYCRVYRFQGQIFKETKPYGDIVEETINQK